MASSALLTLPDLGEGLTQARVLSLLTPAGGQIALDAPVVVVETDKSVVELPAPLTGYVVEWFVRDGDVVKVGEPLARFDAEPAGTAPRPPAPAQPPPAAAAPAQATAPAVPAPVGPARDDGERARISPAARRRARDLGVELAAVVANGSSNGPISAAAVQRFSEQAGPAAAAPGAAAADRGPLVVLSRRLELPLLGSGTPWLGLAETVARALFRAAQRVAGSQRVTLPAGLRVRRFGEAAERRWFASDFAGAGLTEVPAPQQPAAGPVWEVVYAPGDALLALSAGPAPSVQLTVSSGLDPSLALTSTDPAWGEEAVLLLWDELAAELHAIACDRSATRVP